MASKKHLLLPVTPFSKEFAQITDELIKSFVHLKGVPICLLEPNPVYYSTTTATTLLALHHLKALSASLREDFYETLFWLRDNTNNPTTTKKMLEDAPAWDVSEGPSIWTTSLVIWALLGTMYDGPRLNEVKDAVIWLVHQQGRDGGWGQVGSGSNNFFLTSIVLHSLKSALSYKLLTFTVNEREKVQRARVEGVRLIRNTHTQERRVAYWRVQTDEGSKADPTSTLCAIWTLFQENDPQDKSLIQSGIAYLRNNFHEGNIWNFRQIVAEPPILSSTIKIVSFTPSFVIPLLSMGCNPFDEVCLGPMQWLEQHRLEKGWGHVNYGHEGHPLSFTTAYALWAIKNWYTYASADLRLHTEVQVMVKKALKRRIKVTNQDTLKEGRVG
jgi:hypothetical protein